MNNVTDKLILSGSTDGKAILVVATSTPGTLIHTGPTSTSQLHEVYLYAYNSHSSNVELTIERGEATAPNGNIKVTVPSKQGLLFVVPGLILKGNATPLTIKAFAGTTNVITIHGYVHLIA